MLALGPHRTHGRDVQVVQGLFVGGGAAVAEVEAGQDSHGAAGLPRQPPVVLGVRSGPGLNGREGVLVLTRHSNRFL